jgi:hypothetical protein
MAANCTFHVILSTFHVILSEAKDLNTPPFEKGGPGGFIQAAVHFQKI